MTICPPLLGAPNEVVTSSVDHSERKSSTSCTRTDCAEKQKQPLEKESNRDGLLAKTLSSSMTFSEPSSREDSVRKSVSFDLMASQLTVRNLKHDLSRQERRDVWYTAREIEQISSAYRHELYVQKYLATRKEAEEHVENKKNRKPVQRIRKLFSRGKKSIEMTPAA